MKTYIIQLESHDDFISTRDKLGWSKSARIVLVWPKRGRVLKDRIELELVQRHAKALGSQIGLVTHDLEVIGLAQELGIPVFRNVGSAQAKPWRRMHVKRKSVSFQPRGKAEIENIKAELPPRWNDVRASPFTHILAAVLGLISIILLAAIFFPRVEITLKPKVIDQIVEIPLTISPSVKEPNLSGGIPAREISVIVEGTTNGISSGRVSYASEPAQGEIVITNLTDLKIEIPKGTVLLSQTTPPIRYETVQDTALPAGVDSTVTVRIRALSPGSIGNSKEHAVNTVEGNLGGKIKVDNPGVISGGKDQSSPAPTAADYSAARDQLLDDLMSTASKEIAAVAFDGENILPASLQVRNVIEESRTPEVGQPSDKYSLKLRAEFIAWAYSKESVDRVGEMVLDASIPKGYQPLDRHLRIDMLQDPVIEAGRVLWRARVERQIQSEWNQAALIQALRGADPAAAQGIIGQLVQLRSPAVVKLIPSWWFKLPILPYQFQVKVE